MPACVQIDREWSSSTWNPICYAQVYDIPPSELHRSKVISIQIVKSREASQVNYLFKRERIRIIIIIFIWAESCNPMVIWRDARSRVPNKTLHTTIQIPVVKDIVLLCYNQLPCISCLQLLYSNESVHCQHSTLHAFSSHECSSACAMCGANRAWTRAETTSFFDWRRLILSVESRPPAITSISVLIRFPLFPFLIRFLILRPSCFYFTFLPEVYCQVAGCSWKFKWVNIVRVWISICIALHYYGEYYVNVW